MDTDDACSHVPAGDPTALCAPGQRGRAGSVFITVPGRTVPLLIRHHLQSDKAGEKAMLAGEALERRHTYPVRDRCVSRMLAGAGPIRIDTCNRDFHRAGSSCHPSSRGSSASALSRTMAAPAQTIAAICVGFPVVAVHIAGLPTRWSCAGFFSSWAGGGATCR